MQTYATGPSSRTKDLVDLVTSMLNESVDADKFLRRLDIETTFRRMSPKREFAVPTTWKTTFSENYHRVAREAKLPQEFEKVTTAESAVAKWLQPPLVGKATGCIWNPKEQAWT